MPVETTGGKLQTQLNGAGAFFPTQLSVGFQGTIRFWNNNGTALYLSGITASFKASSQVVFDSNSGTNGGGVSLVGLSSIYVNGSSNFTFVNNTAKLLGGGIYFQNMDYNVHQPCFISRVFKTSKSSFNFSSNRANGGRGHHIYASSFISCDCALNSLYDCIGNFSFYDPCNQSNSTATLPTKYSLHFDGKGPLPIFPGLPYQLPITVEDSRQNNVSYEAALENKSSLKICIDPAFLTTLSIFKVSRRRMLHCVWMPYPLISHY